MKRATLFAIAASIVCTRVGAQTYTEITPPASAVTASTSDVNVAANAVDNDPGTRWSGSGDGAWIQLDLGTPRGVARISVAVHQGNVRRVASSLGLARGHVYRLLKRFDLEPASYRSAGSNGAERPGEAQ